MKIAPGVRVNFSNRGLGVSVGTRGVHVSSSATGRQTFSAGLPGTGVRYRKSLNSPSRSQSRSGATSLAQSPDERAQADDMTNLPLGVATTSTWRVLWWCAAMFLVFAGLGATFAPQPGTSWWKGPLEIALATLIVIQLRSTRHLHRVEREPGPN